MAIPFRKTIHRINPPNWYGAAIYVYNNNADSSSDIIATDFLEDDGFAFGVGSVLWVAGSQLSGGYETFIFITPTTVEVSTG